MPPDADETYDYVVVGSGAGGGPVAANLAAAGFQVLLIEAGPEYDSQIIDVPALHGQSTEDPNIRWDFWVRHYADDARQKLDPKYVAAYRAAGQAVAEVVDGVLYPRCSTLGGCTAHNALVTVYPHNSDWEGLARVTGDPSWAPDPMRRYFQRLERCTYLTPGDRDGAESRHGFSGWLAIGQPDVRPALGDTQMLQLIASAAVETLWELHAEELADPLALEAVLERNPGLVNLFSASSADAKAALVQALSRVLDPNDYRVTLERREGVFFVPLALDVGVRNGSRERVRRARAAFGANLTVRTDALVTRVVFEGDRAVGVEYVAGRRLYQAAPAPAGGRPTPGPPVRVGATREVILAGGTFNTPQLLMLSGIGPKEDLEALGLPVRLDRPAVGRYLQDRYEVGVVSALPHDFSLLQGCQFRLPHDGEEPDAALSQWRRDHTGVYASNGAVIAIVRRSAPEKPDPDLFIFGLPAAFKGYYPQYAEALEQDKDQFTWAILKGHTRNTGGRVTLRSTDPLERPRIVFHYFEEGTDTEGDDLRAVVEAVKFVREFSKKLDAPCRLMVRREVQPAPDIQDDDQIAAWVQREAWGHHACGTCRIGAKGDTRDAVLDTDFKVQGVQGLRVVDASVFPSIPGFFIVTSVYMIAEKASEVILRDAGRALPEIV